MTNPNEFNGLSESEFDPGDLMLPTEETRAAFEQVVNTLPFHQSHHTRRVEVQYASEEGDYRVGPRVSQDLHPSGELKSTTIFVDVYEGEDHFTVGAGRWLTDEQRARAQTAVDRVAADLPEREAEWLRAVWGDAHLGADLLELKNHTAEKLLETAPAEVAEWTVERVSTRGQDLRMQGSRFTGNEAFLRNATETGMPVTRLDVQQGDDKDYEYARFGDGREKLYVRDRAKEVRREAPPAHQAPDSSESSIASEVVMAPDVSEIRRAAHAARAEAKRLGLDTVTEGRLKDFMAVLQSAGALEED